MGLTKFQSNSSNDGPRKKKNTILKENFKIKGHNSCKIISNTLKRKQEL
jgi:hypothetical protein